MPLMCHASGPKQWHVRTHSIRFSATYVWDYTFEHDKLDRLRRLVDDGKITLRVAAPYKPEAHRRLEARGTRGRIVITF
jgi:NADPH:quinone reductase